MAGRRASEPVRAPREQAAAAQADDGLDVSRLTAVAMQATAVRWQIVATALVVAGLVWTEVPRPIVVAWVLLAVGVREVRARALQALVRQVDRPIAERLRVLVNWNVALGAANGVAAGFMAWLSPTSDALLTMILVSWGAGAVSASAPVLRAYTVYSVAVFAPLALMWLLEGTPVAIAVAALIAMFSRVQRRFARQNAEMFEASYRIRHANEALLRELAEARDAAEAANRAKTRFLAAASHDLRQPLHALALHSGLLARDPAVPQARAIIGEIATSIDALARLLDALLDISKLDAGIVVADRRPISLTRLLDHLVATHAPQAVERGLVLRAEAPPDAQVATDPLLLQRLLRNLVDNALKYTERGEIVLSARVDADGVEIAVQDSGRGIEPQLVSRVFEEFFRGGDGDADVGDAGRPGGLGLGLAIVRRLADVLGARVNLTSAPGRGTRVVLHLPNEAPTGLRDPGASGAATAPSAPASAGPPALPGLVVLLVDDEASVRHATAQVLRHFGCRPLLAASTAEALARAEQDRPDLVLADCRLGAGDSGVDAVARLRDRWPGLPALLVSGDTDAARLQQANRSGLRLLHKPLTVDGLRSAIEETIGR
jgi:signal transduction histidine kinase/CheY-like chemotaxis protein